MNQSDDAPTPSEAAERPGITQTDLVRGLQGLGLNTGDLVLVHSSLKAFGHVVGGADAVIDALLEALGPAGTLLMPSHTDVPEYSVGLYDRATTPVRRNIGRIPDTFWRRPGVRRGRHPPRHPWAGVGPLAEHLIALSENRPVGSQHYRGILSAIAELDGVLLLLGCTHTSSTSVHTAQAAAYNEIERSAKRRAEFLRDFDAVEKPLEETGAIRRRCIGLAHARLMRSRDLFEVVRKMYVTTFRGQAFTVEEYRDEPGFMPAADYPSVIAAMRELVTERTSDGRFFDRGWR